MSGPASWAAATAAQAGMEARLTARRGENLLAMVGIPVGVLLVVGLAVTPDRLDGLVPAALSIALVASGMVNLGIATAYERGYGVLKRLGGSPLGRSGLVGAKMAVVLGIGLAQVAALLLIASAGLGWRPGPDASIGGVLVVTVIGAATFAAIGLAIAGTLRPEAALVTANVLFLVGIVLVGGLGTAIVLPAPWSIVVDLSPIGALGDAFAAALAAPSGPRLAGASELARSLAVLAIWGAAASAVAVRGFRWD